MFESFTGEETFLEKEFASSTSVLKVKYNTISNTLRILYKNNKVYEYYGVTREIYDGLVSASSVGTYVSSIIKKYKFKQLDAL